jgi:hypothetical protein
LDRNGNGWTINRYKQRETLRKMEDAGTRWNVLARTFDPQRKPEHAAFMRKLINNFGAANYCENPLCRRAGECMHPKVRCFWENFDLMQRLVFPAMRRKLKQMEAQGDYVPDEDDAAHAAPVSNASKSKR